MIIQLMYHNYLFLFGFVYYLLLPLIVVLGNLLDDYVGIQHLNYYFKTDFLLSYILIISMLGISFYIGSVFLLKFKKYPTKLNSIEKIIGNRDIFLILLPFFLYGQYMIFKNRNELFSGYLQTYNVEFLGTISTLNLLFLFFFLYCKGKMSKRTRTLDVFLLFSLLEYSIVLLGLGSRMYALIPCVSYFVFLLDKRVVQFKKVLLSGFCLILFFLFIGVWRKGSVLSFETLLYIGVAEPAFTWISAVSMFSMNDLPLWAFPSNFISSFVNFAPTILVPNKSEFITPIDLNFDSPFGATSILLSLIANFGILGSCCALFMLGALLSLLKTNANNLFAKTYYYCICGIIPFQLFRDPFSVVNKMFFFNLFFLPFLLFMIETILYKNTKIKL